MPIPNDIPLKGQIRFVLYCCGLPLNKLTVAVIRLLPPNISKRIEDLTFIGPPDVIDQAMEVLKDLQTGCPDLYAVLVSKECPVFCFCPWCQRSTSYQRYFYAGEEYLCWEKTGILVHLVWGAFRMMSKLHHPSVSFSAYYDGGDLLKNTAQKMANWLIENNQPEEFVDTFQDLANQTAIHAKTRIGS